MSPTRRRLVTSAGVAWVVAAAAAWAAAPTAEPLALTVVPVDLDSRDPGRAAVGALEFLGGVRVSSTDPSFGGLSGLRVDPTGRELLAVTDRGSWFTATVTYDADGRLTGLADAELRPMMGIDDKVLLPPWSDSESIAEVDGAVYVAFERRNRLYRYGPPQAPWVVRPEWLWFPEALAEGPRNGGIEALAELADGRILAISEAMSRGEGRAAWILDGQSAVELTIAAVDGFQPTGAAMLPNGDVLLLERRFRLLGGFAARLRRIAVSELVPGAAILGTEVATLAPPLSADNFEAVAAVPLPGGGVLVLVLSDDNFSALQRTLLLAFRLGG